MASSPTARARRVSGGRRRSIVIPMEDAQSPIVVDVPENESVRQLPIHEKIADLKVKMMALETYNEQIAEECDVWDSLVEQHKSSLMKEATAVEEQKENEVDVGMRPRYVTEPAREAFERFVDERTKLNEKKNVQVLQALANMDKQRDEEEKKNKALAKIHKQGHSTEYLQQKIHTSKKLSESIHNLEQKTADFFKSRGVNYVPFEGILPSK